VVLMTIMKLKGVHITEEKAMLFLEFAGEEFKMFVSVTDASNIARAVGQDVELILWRYETPTVGPSVGPSVVPAVAPAEEF
jgi:hypothetical protein